MAIITLNNNSLSSVTALPAGVGGKVLQTVTSTNNQQISTTSTSFVATNLKATITPTSTSNKIIILVSGTVYNNTVEKNTLVTVYRGGVSSGTNLGSGGSFSSLSRVYSAGGEIVVPTAVTFEDNPSTTSATLFEVAIKIEPSGTGYFGINNEKTSIVLMEIAG